MLMVWTLHLRAVCEKILNGYRYQGLGAAITKTQQCGIIFWTRQEAEGGKQQQQKH